MPQHLAAEVTASLRERSGTPVLVWSPAGPMPFEHLFVTWPGAAWWQECPARRPPLAECGARAAGLDPQPSGGGRRCARCQALLGGLLSLGYPRPVETAEAVR